MTASTGLLLINLGTPDSTELSDVKQYLRTFLSDERVIDIPAALRFLLLNLVIIPTRSKNTAKAYEKIWTKDGSPLRYHSLALKEKLQEKLGDTILVAFGMRYGNPSIESALNQLKDCQKLIILPLYPQYASASTGSSIEYTLKLISKQAAMPSIRLVRDFYDSPLYIEAMTKRIKSTLNRYPKAHLLLSYHGLPERQLIKGGCEEICSPVCSEKRLADLPHCYRAQCYKSSQLIIKALGLNKDDVTTCFQSRLGRLPWIQPYTDTIIEEKRQQGVKDLVIACPSFCTDCLETLEEIGMAAKASWQEKGGENLVLVPSLNSDDDWVDALAEMTKAIN